MSLAPLITHSLELLAAELGLTFADSPSEAPLPRNRVTLNQTPHHSTPLSVACGRSPLRQLCPLSGVMKAASRTSLRSCLHPRSADAVLRGACSDGPTAQIVHDANCAGT